MGGRKWVAVRVLAIAMVVASCGSAAVDTQGRNGTLEAGLPAASAAGLAFAPEQGAVRGDTVTGGDAAAGKAAPGADQALIVKTGTMVVDVANLDAALARAQASVAAAGGYVSGSDRSGQGGQQVATMTYRIPAATWDVALEGLRRVATSIEKEQTNAVEVTGQVLDLGARITNLRATEAALQGIMAKATKIPDVLAVQQQLTDVQGQIEQLTTQQQHLQQQAAFGTLSVTFIVPVVAVTTATTGWDPGHKVDQAMAQLIELGQGLASVAIWLVIVGLPSGLVLLLVAIPFVWAARRVRARVRRGPPGGPSWGTGPGAGPRAGAQAAGAAGAGTGASGAA